MLEMSKNLLLELLDESVHYDWIFDTFDRAPEEVRARFYTQVLQRMLQADSPEEAVQKLLQADSPEEAVQKLLQADSPEEAALKFIETEEQLNRLIELLQERQLAFA